MIASQKIGKSFMGALKYNLDKMFNADPKLRAELLSTNFVSMDIAVIKQEVDIVRSFRPALNKYVYHTSLNFSKEDMLDNKTMLAIAEDYLRLSGYTNNQYFIFRHHDADHPHLHLLVNRITFDSDVVSDSNNYKKSEAILRKLELQYNLVTVEHSNHIPVERTNSISTNRSNRIPVEKDNVVSADQGNVVSVDRSSSVKTELYNRAPLRAPTKNEIEMVIRTHKGSGKMVLQDKLLHLVSKPGITLQDFLIKCEAEGIHLLFNQASTGRVSGITYFYGDFKIKGQALGNRFKWAELIKTVDYEQGRDGKAIRQANEQTRGIYGTAPAQAWQVQQADWITMKYLLTLLQQDYTDQLKRLQQVEETQRNQAKQLTAMEQELINQRMLYQKMLRWITILAAIMIGGILVLGMFQILK